MKNKIKVSFFTNKKFYFLILLVVFLLSLTYLFIFYENIDSQPLVDRSPLIVEVVEAKYADETSVDKIDISGKTMAYESNIVKVNTTGVVQKLNFSIGSFVKKGDILAILSTKDIDHSIKVAKEEYEIHKKQIKAIKKLLSDKVISYSEYAKYRLEYLDSKQKYYNFLSEKEKHYVIAPSSGVIEEKFVAEGEFVTQKDKIAILNDNSKIKITFYIDETDYHNLRKEKNSYAKIYIPAVNESFPIENLKASNTAQDKNHSVYIEALISNENYHIIPGLYVNITIFIPKKEKVIKLPNSSIIFEDEKPFVYIVDKNDVAKQLSVETGNSNDNYVDILSGIKVDDKIITSGKNSRLHDGVRVKIEEATK